MLGFSNIAIRQWTKKMFYGKESWQSVLYELNLGEHVVLFEERGIKELKGITDVDLIEMKMDQSFIKRLRQTIQYEKETWQRVLYELKLGEHVLLLEQRGIQEFDVLKDEELGRLGFDDFCNCKIEKEDFFMTRTT
eukprot:UN32196